MRAFISVPHGSSSLDRRVSIRSIATRGSPVVGFGERYQYRPDRSHMCGGQTSRLIPPKYDRYTLRLKFSAEDEPPVAMCARHEKADQSALGVENAGEEDRRHGNGRRGAQASNEVHAVISGCVARSQSSTRSARFLQSCGEFDYSPLARYLAQTRRFRQCQNFTTLLLSFIQIG